MARIPPAGARGPFARLVFWLVRRMLGKVPTAVRVAAWHRRVLRAHVEFERHAKAAKTLPARLKSLVQIRVATLVGCPF